MVTVETAERQRCSDSRYKPETIVIVRLWPDRIFRVRHTITIRIGVAEVRDTITVRITSAFDSIRNFIVIRIMIEPIGNSIRVRIGGNALIVVINAVVVAVATPRRT